ncbi:MAG TPA: hypothetical protein VGI46_12340 [Candidatus Acidoferrum sp.]
MTHLHAQTAARRASREQRNRVLVAPPDSTRYYSRAGEDFGEDATIDKLIRQFGYRDSPATLEAVKKSEELRANLSAAAHLIHGSSRGRFTITYCPGRLAREEVTAAGFQYGDLKSVASKYNPEKMKQGYNTVDGEEVFFVPNPGPVLWTDRDRCPVKLPPEGFRF